MFEKNVKPVTKTMATARADSAVANKPYTTKAGGAAATTKPVAGKSATEKPMAKPTLQERYRIVETEAYFIAEQHSFQGSPEEHWAAAERKLNLS